MGKKKTIDIKRDEKAEVEAPKSSNRAKREFEVLIKAYKIQNPVKYEQKREALKRKLNNL